MCMFMIIVHVSKHLPNGRYVISDKDMNVGKKSLNLNKVYLVEEIGHFVK